MRIAGKRFENSDGKWVQVVSTHGNTVRYNCHGVTVWAGGSCECSRYKFKQLIERGGYNSVEL